MREIERNILRFLIDGKAYSDGAIMKNFGITEIQLKEIYDSLLAQGYLETYASYEERNSKKNDDMNENHCGTACNCDGSEKESGCGCDKTDDTNCCGESNLDKNKILVLTEKAINS